MPTKNSTYIILGLVLLILAGIGGYFLFQVYQTNQSTSTYTSETTPKIELLPTDSPEEETSEVTPASTSASIITPTTIKTTITPTKVPTLTPTKVPTKSPTATPTSATSSNSLQTFTSDKDGFSIDYSTTRKIYQDTESVGNRYTFYLSSGNFAVHVGLNGQWSWTNPDRQLDENSLVAGQPSFRYDIAAQTIVDVQYNNKNYTIQCVHNGNKTLKAECESFISSFKLL
jgi:cytoskeletal protein RodZ